MTMTLPQKITLFLLSLTISVLLYIQLRPETEVLRCMKSFEPNMGFIEQQFDANPNLKDRVFKEAGITNLKDLLKERCTYWVKNGQRF